MSNPVHIIFPADAVLAKITGGSRMAQAWLDNEVLKDSTPYVPRLTGQLERSGIDGTKIGSGLIVYNKVYAKRQYYGEFQHSTQAHPQACRLWFEAAKAVNKEKWVRGAKAMAGRVL